jgi:ABC-type dipeptide/oligopeptide/nickel transport system permease component
MAKFIIRRLLLMFLTMFLVSVAVFAITEAAPGNVARNVLGSQITPEQEASFLAQNGLDKPLYQRYLSWLFGTDWRASGKIGLPVRRITTEAGFKEWWAEAEDGTLVRWQLEGEDLIARRLPEGASDDAVEQVIDNDRWQVKDPATEIERLEAYRTELETNPQLTEADRQAILQQLDQVLEVLRQARDEKTGQAELKLSLEQGPEAVLTSLIDAEAAGAKTVLQDVAKAVTGKYPLLQANTVYWRLSAPGAEDLELTQLQAYARQLDRAALRLEELGLDAAEQVRQASAHLMAGEALAAQEAMAEVAGVLDSATGSLAEFLSSLESGDYRRAVEILNALSDPAQTPFDEVQLAVVPTILAEIGKGLEDAAPELASPLIQAAESLEAGEVEVARTALAQAADTLSELGCAIARSDAASGARVVRVFWGVDTQDHAVRWEKGTGKQVWVFIVGTGWKSFTGGPQEYIPLQKGLLRGDPGKSLRTGRPVSDLLFTRLRNSLVLAGTAFVIVMPLALFLGLIAGLREGRVLDRTLSIGGMMFSVTPEFATGIFLILIFSFWLELVPGATVFGEDAPWTRPDMLVLPVLTLTLIELGYVLRITRASMVDVMKAPYIRTAFLKGLPYWRVVTKHAIRNALMAPITVIMLHVNWLLGGIVVVEVIFGYPGLGSYLLDSALFKDFNAIEAGAIILVAIAVGTQLLADIIYTFLNPRIRYA